MAKKSTNSSKKVKQKKTTEEEILNVPNVLTIIRIMLTFVVMYLIVIDYDIRMIISIFVFAALTDWFDGQIARKFHLETEFGRKADMIADRFLWMGTAVAFVTIYGFRGYLSGFHGIQLLFIMSREIISLPFAIIAFFSGKKIPQARKVAKWTTLLQGFALPSLILGIYYGQFYYLSVPLSIVIGITGTISAIYYIKDINDEETK